MPFQAVVDTVEIDIIYTQHAQILQNVFYAKLPGGYVLADLEALAVGIDAQVQGTWKTQQVIEAFYDRVEVRGLAEENDLIATNNTNAGVGGNVNGALPNNVTLSIKKESGRTGRSARGRTYWIGCPQDKLKASDENMFQAAYVTSVTTAVDTIRQQIPSIGLWEAVLVSRFSGGLPRAFGLTFPWVSSVAVNDVVDTQRGRLP